MILTYGLRELTEQRRHEAQAVGEHRAFDHVQVGQHYVHEQDQTEHVQRLHDEHEREVEQRRPLARLEETYAQRAYERADLRHDERQQQTPNPRHALLRRQVHHVELVATCGTDAAESQSFRRTPRGPGTRTPEKRPVHRDRYRV